MNKKRIYGMDTILDFGKYKGLSLKHIPLTYLGWMYENNFKLSKKARQLALISKKPKRKNVKLLPLPKHKKPTIKLNSIVLCMSHLLNGWPCDKKASFLIIDKNTGETVMLCNDCKNNLKKELKKDVLNYASIKIQQPD